MDGRQADATQSNIEIEVVDTRAQKALFRAMEQAEDGLPALGASWKRLGVRLGTGPQTNIPVHGGVVYPGTGGLSVIPDDPLRALPAMRHLIPKWADVGGIGRFPVWRMYTSDLDGDLTYRPDPDNPGNHGFIEPARNMPFEDYEVLIRATRSHWVRVL